IFQARFNSANWSGQLLSYAIDPTNGQLLPDSRVDAAEKLRSASADSRKIFTRDSAGEPVRSNSAELQADATRVLQLDPNNDPREAQRMLNYLRASESNEATEDNTYRGRRDSAGHNKPVDIVSSAPLYVGAPPFRYRDSLESAAYSTFAFNIRNRAKM